ncbi:Carboxypeptidase [Dirofilaria immitis]|nr:Carboxypeptidase [Dirofilaria immitis]
MIRKHHWLLLVKFFAALSFVATLFQDDAEIDQINDPPGLTFAPNFDQLVESQNDPSIDPLVLWFNGASGCNSLDGLLAQIGPFRVNQDGETLFENIYSWNKVVNLLFLDSPYGIGYSYRNTSISSDLLWNDDQTTENNADALEQFFQRFKEYQNRDFYITGQGYAGVYGPILINVLLKRFQSLTNCCLTAVPGPLAYCNFSQYINWTTNKPIDDSECATKVVQYAFFDFQQHSIDPFNYYQDCYMDPVSLPITLNTTLYKNQPEKTCFGIFVDQGSRINIGSTDAQHGFPCWIRSAVKKYLNLPNKYNFLSNEWFVTRLTEGYRKSERKPWNFKENSFFKEQLAGFSQQFFMKCVTIDFLTIKGAGHFAPLDRSGPSLQMFKNFIRKNDYNTRLFWIMQEPILPQYSPPPKTILPRQLTDIIYNLPGLTYAINFYQYSGYLKASKGNFLHYWFVESQNDPSIDPLIIWFNGGPGCSSLLSLLHRKWSLANVLYIDSPRQVGFSYQNWAFNADVAFDDTSTTIDAYEAILDFFTIFPIFKENDLYISGESYAGTYVPLLTAYIVQNIQMEQNIKLNLKGMIIGNGYYSGINERLGGSNRSRRFTASIIVWFQDPFFHGWRMDPCTAHTVFDYLYFHGFYGKKLWDELQQCCPQQYDGKPTMKCTFDDYININTKRRPVPKPGLRTIYASSTDALDDFPCYMANSITKYLNQAYVCSALHIPSYIPSYQDCNPNIGHVYMSLYNDTAQFFQQLFDSNYPLRTLIYNGDLDAVCNFLHVEWFIEKFAKSNSMSISDKKVWLYQLGMQLAPQVGGYMKRFEKDGTTIDLITFKGAGHAVPLDRAGPMLQVLTNFIRQKDYNDISPFSMDRQPLLPQFNLKFLTRSTPECVTLSFVATLIQDDAEIDRIINLPGLTFVPNFTQYSGFLPTKTRNFLHYWLIESQNNPSTDPLVLWFNGASGCNSLDGLLAQIGPFRVDQDGETLFENIYSWNKQKSCRSTEQNLQSPTKIKRIPPIATELNAELVLSCDVANEGTIDDKL